MGIGIYNKLKKAMKSIGERIGGFTKKALSSLPQIASVGKQMIGAVSPILSTTFPGSKPILNTIDKGLDYVGQFGNTFSKGFRGSGGIGKGIGNGIGKSLINELD